MKQTHKLFLTAALSLTLFVGSTSSAFAQDTKTWTGECVGDVAGDSDVATLTGIECLVGNALTIGTTAVGIASFVMLLVGAFLYLTSGGNPKGTEAGQKTLTFAVIGIVVSLTGIIALNFISSFTGVKTIKTFQIRVDK